MTISFSTYGCGLSYQWQTDGGGGGSLTNIPGATNSSVVTTPTTVGTWNYDVVVTNSYGSLTSLLATVTVLPASAPILTSDINQWSTNVYGFIGGSVNFYANFGLGTMPITNQWLVKLDSGGDYAPVAGGASNAWTLVNIQFSSAGNYELAATNAVGRSNSSPAHLTALADPAASPSNGVTNLYANCVMTNHPWAYWKFEETNDTFFSSMQAYDYSGHNFDATYGNSDGTANSGCLDGGESTIYAGQYGPGNGDGYSGFPANNGCATMSYNHNNGNLTVPPLNLNTNTVTFTMWIYLNPDDNAIPANTGLFMWRNGYDAAGIGFGSTISTNVNGNTGVNIAELGYTWNTNSSATYNWHSGLYPCPNTWNFVACVITPSTTTMYLYYVSFDAYGFHTNLFKAISTITNAAEAFSGGTTWIGGDNWSNGRTFDGSIDEVAVFTNALSETQVQDLFLKALAIPWIPPTPPWPVQPTNTTLFMGQTLQLTAIAIGIPTPWYQWQYESSTTWSSLGTAVGRTPNASTLVYPNWTSTSVTNFRCIATNYYGAATSHVAVVTVIPVANWNKGLWTLNFAIAPAPLVGGQLYVGRGVLGTNTYWNALSGSQFANTPPSLLDDGVTVCGINFGSINYWVLPLSDGGNNALLDNYCGFSSGGTAFVFTSVPNGKYNLALYGIAGAYADRGTIFTVNGVNQSVTNAQDAVFLPDNTVIFTNVLVSNERLEVDMMPVPSVPSHNPNTEGDFNGAQLELIKYGPQPPVINCADGTCVLTWVDGGGLLEATNVMGPWITNTHSSPYTFSPTGYMKFYRIYNPSFP